MDVQGKEQEESRVEEREKERRIPFLFSLSSFSPFKFHCLTLGFLGPQGFYNTIS
jgi:hypothetical protein